MEARTARACMGLVVTEIVMFFFTDRDIGFAKQVQASLENVIAIEDRLAEIFICIANHYLLIVVFQPLQSHSVIDSPVFDQRLRLIGL